MVNARTGEQTQRREGPPADADIAQAYRRRLYQLADLSVPWAIRAAVTLGIADHLAAGPMATEALAGACQVQPRPLYAMLNLLAADGIFEEIEPGWFALTPMASLLRNDVDGSFHDALVGPHPDRVSAATSQILHSVRTGRSAYEHLFGETVFECTARDPEANRSFNGLMHQNVAQFVDLLAHGYEWDGVDHVVDVGGGTGEVVARLLAARPHLHATLVDLPQVVASAPEVLAAEGVEDRCAIVAGSFMGELPGGADCYLLSNVLHDWNDADALAILASCRAAMGDQGRLLVVERLVPAGEGNHVAKYMNVRLLVVFGGIERSADEVFALLASAHFQVRKTTALTPTVTLIEAGVRP